MNHFEELGLSRTATTEEIRSAYRTLAWMLHPDRHPTEKHRRLAEIQMRRVNESVGVLLNATSRGEYEAGLDAPKTPPDPPAPTKVVVVPPAPPERKLWFRRVDAWSVFLFVSGMAFASVLWLGLDASRSSTAARVGGSATAAGASEPNPREDSELRARVQEIEDRLKGMQLEAQPLAAKRVSRTAVPGLPGAWYYDFDPPPGSEGIATTKRIYLSIAEENGVLRGTYSAQGNPLAGEPANAVRFQFEGKAAGPEVRLPWTAAGGGSGEIEMRLRGPDTLETKWRAYVSGSGAAEDSGSAVLRRLPSR